MKSEEMRNQRRDRKRSKRYAPKVGGLPKGFPAGYWLERVKVKGKR